MPSKRTLTDRTQLLDQSEVAVQLKVPVSTLTQWRWLGKGPRWLKVGRYVRYDPADVKRWLDGGADSPRRN
jgi:hypothetical protein